MRSPPHFPFPLLALFACLLGLSACDNLVLHAKSKSEDSIGSITVGFGASASTAQRTILPGFANEVSSIIVTLSSGPNTVIKTVASTSASVSFPGIAAGSWDIDIRAYDVSAIQIGSGSMSGVALSAGSTKNLSVPLSFTGDGSGQGKLDIKLLWPKSTKADYLVWEFNGFEGENVPDSEGDNYTTTLTNVASPGSHELILTFKRGGSIGPVVATFIEAVNIIAGMASGSWIDGNGTVQNAMSFSPSDFFDSSANLRQITFYGALPQGTLDLQAKNAKYYFSSDQQITGNFAVSVEPGASGQEISYSWCDTAGTWSSSTSESKTSSDLDIKEDGNNKLVVTVTAPDRTTKNTYTFIYPFITSAAAFGAIYDDLALKGSYILVNDIPATAPVTSPIGDSTIHFNGTFDGNHHSINLSISRVSSRTGLFGYIDTDGEVMRLTVLGSIAGGQDTGAIAGYNMGTISDCSGQASVEGGADAGGIVGSNVGTILNCSSSANVSGQENTGGIAGYSNGTISGCTRSDSGNPITGFLYVGGIAGYNEGYITSSSSTADVSGNAYIGGITGENGHRDDIGVSQSGILEYCYATGKVVGTGSYIGGLVGANNNSAIIRYCYAVGAVNGYSNVGGFVGLNLSGTVENSYARGAVTGLAYVGGFVGYSSGSNYTCCYSTGAIICSGTEGIFVGYENGDSDYGEACYASDSQTVPGGYSITLLPQGAMPYNFNLSPYAGTWGLSAWVPTINDRYPYLTYFGAGTLSP